MKKHLFIIILFCNFSIYFYGKVIIKDYNEKLSVPVLSLEVQDDKNEKKSLFSFRIGNVDGELSIYGYWKLRLGYGAGFTVFPDYTEWLLTRKGITDGIFFEQKRLFSLDWITDSGIYLHLFFNDNVDDTEYTFRYTVDKFFKSFYITNKFEEYEVNPFRTLKGGKTQDINFGFNMGNRIYQGRFDAQFDSVYYKNEKFKGGKKDASNKILSNQFIRGKYYYLPDEIITGSVEVYVSETNGVLFDDNIRYKRLNENIDFILDSEHGYIKFNESVHGKKTLIYYQTIKNGNIYKVGDAASGTSSYPENLLSSQGKTYFILSFINKFSLFEEKNSYQIAKPHEKVSSLNADILNLNNERLRGFIVFYDEYTGAIRITKNSVKGDVHNKYPFWDYVDAGIFYTSYYTPRAKDAKNIIDYSCFIQAGSLTLAYKPVAASIKVLYNSVLLNQAKYSYDSINNTVILNFETSSTDIIEVSYLTDQEEAYNLTLTYRNDFRLNKYFIIGDSYWYKMPIKLWEESYYDKMHSAEFLYNTHLLGDFHKLLENEKNAKLELKLNAGFSMFYPDLKGITIVDDFERELTGYKLNLHYINWYPVNIPSNALFSTIPVTAQKGRLFFRNMHKYQRVSDSTFISIYDREAPDKESYSNGNRIGPYSSSDGFTYNLNNDKFEDRENTLSLITEFELNANQAVSFVFPISSVNENIDFSSFNGLNMAVKSDYLSGNIRIYVDAGAVSEKFNESDTTVQKEIIDEGLSYHESGIELFKGKNDGVLSTNDLDNNGVLDGENPADITRILDPNSAFEYITLTKKYNNLSLKIQDPDKLKDMRGIRITIFSDTNSSGRLLFNQIRFTESGWTYNKAGSSSAQEVSPIEDPYLLEHIFSKENPDIDKKLHYQRYKERTLRVNLAQNDAFHIEKNFSSPIDIGNFNNFTLFVLLKEKSDREIKLTLTDTYGNEASDYVALRDAAAGRWQRFDFKTSSLSSVNKSNKLITKVRIDFLNETSDIAGNTIYIDEISLSDAVPSFGFGSKNEFLYSEPSLIIKHEDFTIFKSPYLKYSVLFNTPNFLRNEFTPYKDYYYNNDITTMFTLAEIDYLINSNLDFIFKNNTAYNPAEILKLKLSKNADEFNPFMFQLNYDYKKLGYLDAAGVIQSENISHDRSLFLEVGADFQKKMFFRFNYDTDTVSKRLTGTTNKYYTDYALNIKNIYHKSSFSILNKVESTDYSGNFSLDNLGYLLRDDFTKFYYHGNTKGMNFNTRYSFFMIEPLYFTHNISVAHTGDNNSTLDTYDFYTKFYHNVSLDLYLSYLDKKNVFFKTEYQRNTENSYYDYYDKLYWSDYFNEYNESIAYIIPIIFYPPFSSLYKKNNVRFIDETTRFNLLSDKLKFTWDWSIFLKSNYFLPYNFSFSFTESIINKIYYNPSYYFTFILTGGGENENESLVYNMNYSISEIIGIKDYENTFNTIWSYTIGFNFRTPFDIEFTVIYDQLYTNAFLNRELTHKIIFANMIYSNFFKKNRITGDKYGFEFSFLTEISSYFHNKFDNYEISKIDNPLNLDETVKIGYRFNKNFTLNNIIKLGYTLDYSQVNKEFVNRFGAELSTEGVFTF